MATGEVLARAGWRVAGMAVMLVVLSGCASTEDVRCAINEINTAFRAEYETILAEKGARVFEVGRPEAYDAVRISMARLGMTVESQDSSLGFVNVYAAAPRPLDLKEWRQAAEADLPKLRGLASKCIGLASAFLRFEPEGLQIVITATVLPTPRGSEIALTMRMREVAPPPSGMPRREYAPPAAVRIGLDKIWIELEREFMATRRKP